MRVCVVFVAGGEMQNKCLWPSYNQREAAWGHDLVVVHRNNMYLPQNIKNNYGEVIFLNKIIDGEEVPHRAFGAYRFAFNSFKDNYDLFVFFSDDVVIRRDFWLRDIVRKMQKHEYLGFFGSQIFNGHKKYPHESHVRAPMWGAKTGFLSEINWEFNDDHDGEMKIGDQLASVGCFGIQIGNKLNLAYDSFEKDHITQLLENKFFKKKKLFNKFEEKEDIFIKMAQSYDEKKIAKCIIKSPYDHIGKQNYLLDVEPFDSLIYYPTLETAKKYMNIREVINDTYILE